MIAQVATDVSQVSVTVPALLGAITTLLVVGGSTVAFLWRLWASVGRSMGEISAKVDLRMADLASKMDQIHLEIVRDAATKDEIRELREILDRKASAEELNGLGKRVNSLSSSVAKMEGHSGRSRPTSS